MTPGKHAEVNAQTNTDAGIENKLEQWKKKLGGATPILHLPTDRPRSVHSINSINTFSGVIPQIPSARLYEFADKLNTNLPSVLLAAFENLLYRYTSQDDILILFVSSETTSQVDESGILVRSSLRKLILRTSVAGDPIFPELLKRVHDDLVEAELDQPAFFKSLIAGLIDEGLDIRSFPQIIFQIESGDAEEDKIFDNAPVADLHLILIETPDGLLTKWKYNSALFNEETIARVSGHYNNLLTAIISNSNENISRLKILSAEERTRILFEWNNTGVEYPSQKCIHELFEEQVIKNPGATAVELHTKVIPGTSATERTLTYHQLNTKANQLAHYLKELGIGPDVLVGVCMSRSLELAVALIGVLKAGGAYVPIDPAYPKERIDFMLKDSGVSVLITQQQLERDFLHGGLHTICLDSQWAKIAQHSNKNITAANDPSHLAYVIYTSGSTGIPKGTLITHRGVVNYLTWCIGHYSVSRGSGAPVNSSIAFDATVTSFFAPLLAGRKILLLPEKEEIEALAEVLSSRKGFSLVKITPAHLEILRHMFLENELDGQTSAFVIGGEALSAGAVDAWRKHAPKTRIINEYGPTETVVGCCTYEIGSSEYAGDDVPIGKPIANTQMYILDQHMEPVPVGVCGEIYIGGAGVGRGYLNRTDLTEQRFVPNPFSADPEARLYKTGDLARYLSDGNIVFQGRIDFQVKIRGYRIELGEIESALSKHPLIEHVAVLARSDNAQDKRLVAYVVTGNPRPLVSELRSYLGKKLPDYMTPAVFVFMESLPLTTNGKIDRTALPAPEKVQAGHERAYVAPRNNTELALKKIFEKCLKVSSIGITDDFFELGGNSVQAAIAFSQIRKVLGKSLPLSTLIIAPTIGQLAVYIDRQTEKPAFSSLVPIQPNGDKPPLFCIHGGLGNVLFYRHLSNRLGTDQPVYGLQAKGLTSNEEPFRSIEEMAAAYIREIRSVQSQGPYYVSGYCFGAIVAFEIAHQLVKAGQKIAFLGSFNGIGPAREHALKLSSLFRMYRTDSLKHLVRYPVLISKFLLRRYSLKAYYAIVNRARGISYNFYKKKGRMMPDSLRRQYVVDAIDAALKKYKPEVYPGQLIIFRSPKIFKNPHLRWTKLISGGIKTHDMPGNYKNRRFIMHEPYVQSLAEELKKYLGS